MSPDQTTKEPSVEDAFLRVCEVLGIQASRFSYLDAAALRAERDRMRLALQHVVHLIENGTPLEAMAAALNALEGN